MQTPCKWGDAQPCVPTRVLPVPQKSPFMGALWPSDALGIQPHGSCSERRWEQHWASCGGCWASSEAGPSLWGKEQMFRALADVLSKSLMLTSGF